MQQIVLVFTCLAWRGLGHRMETSRERDASHAAALAKLLLADKPARLILGTDPAASFKPCYREAHALIRHREYSSARQIFLHGLCRLSVQVFMQDKLLDDRQEYEVQVKTWQRCGPQYWDLWRNHVRAQGHRVYDPKRHDVSVLTGFLTLAKEVHDKEQLNNGGTDNNEIARMAKIRAEERVKALQHRDPFYNEAWEKYIRSLGHDQFDPKKYDLAVLGDFLANVTSAKPDLNELDDAHKEEYEEQVKTWQRRGPEYNELWRNYLRDLGHSNFDPSFHDVSVLKGFFTRAPQVASKVRTSKHDDVHLTKTMSEKRVDVSRRSDASYSNNAANLDSDASHADREEYEVQVRTWQRRDSRYYELWANHVRDLGHKILDPKRLDISVLTSFLTVAQDIAEKEQMSHGEIDHEELARVAKIRAEERVKALRSRDPLYNKSWEKYIRSLGYSSLVPKRYDLSVLGGFLANATGERNDLEGRVKAWQSRGQGYDALWKSYILDLGHELFDPARHDVSVLSEFLAKTNALEAQIQNTQLDESRAALVDKIRALQAGGYWSLWCSYADELGAKQQS